MITKRKQIWKRIILGLIGLLVLFIVVVVVNVVVLVSNESAVSVGQPIKDYGSDTPALLVVDIQEIITGERSDFPNLQKNSAYLINNINQLADSFKLYNYPVVYVRSEIANPFINLVNNTYAKGSDGVKYDKRLKIVSNLEVIKTGKDAFRKTNLDELLKKSKVNEIYVVGLDAAECVDATIQAALNRKYKVNVVEEAVTSKFQKTADSMMVCFRNRGVRVIPLDSLRLRK